MKNSTKRKLKKLIKHPILFFRDARENKKKSSSLNNLQERNISKNIKIPMKDSCKEIELFTQYYDVNSIKIDEEFIWPYLRHILYTYANLQYLKGVSFKNIGAFNLQNAHPSQINKKSRAEIKKLTNAKEIENITPQEVDYLFLTTCGSTEETIIENNIYLRVTDPLFEISQKYGKSLKIDIVKSTSESYINSLKQYENYLYKPEIILPPTKVSSGYVYNLKMKDTFFKVFPLYIKSLNSINQAKLNQIIDYEMHTRDYYIEILKKYNPKVLFLKAFHYHAPLISAAKSLRIKTVDIQHGLQMGWYQLYNNWSELPNEGYQSIPDYFAVWDKSHYDHIKKVFNKNHKPIIMGQPWLEKIRNFKRTMSNELSDKLGNNKVKVLIILQAWTELPNFYLELIEKNSDENIQWIIRHHPASKTKFTITNFTNKKMNNILIDEEIDKILFHELFEKIDITISEGSALSYEASYFGTLNLITSKENYASFSSEEFVFIENSNEFKDILNNFKKKSNENIKNNNKINYDLFFDELNKKENNKKLDLEKHYIEIEHIEKEIQNLNSLIYDNNFSVAYSLFKEILKDLVKLEETENIYNTFQNICLKEANFFYNIISNHFYSNNYNYFITDSLGLPRPKETFLSNGGINLTSTFMLNDLELTDNKLKTHAQRYLTTEKLLDNWEFIFRENTENKDLFIHLGLNDCSERIFLEKERLALDLLTKENKDILIEFAKSYRKEIITSQENHSYVPIEKFRENIEEIIKRAKKEKFKSLTFFNIIQFPESHENETPGSRKTTEMYNNVFKYYKEKYSEFVNLVDLNQLIYSEGFDKCMLDDNHHLSHYGHRLLSQQIQKMTIKKEGTDMKKIVIIGVGQLGSRYLQGLKKLSFKCSIELIEPSKDMQNIAIQRYNEIEDTPNIKSLKFCENISSLNDDIDLVIISTNSDIRAKITKELIENKNIKNLILEKVLFTDYEDYNYFENEFKKQNINVWVNHPRRAFEFYDKFLPDIRKSKNINYLVQGSNWNMASNTLHFLDHLQYLVGESNGIIINKSENFLGNTIESKRKNFYEIFGTLVGKIGKGKFIIDCSEEENIPPNSTITITTEDFKLIVDESNNSAIYSYKEDNWEWKEFKGKIVYYQSELTTSVVEDIINNETSRLPSYEEAIKLHKPFIKVVKNIIEEDLNKKLDICPIS